MNKEAKEEECESGKRKVERHAHRGTHRERLRAAALRGKKERTATRCWESSGLSSTKSRNEENGGRASASRKGW